MKNNYKIRQLSENEFIVLKEFTKTEIKGFLWWEKTIKTKEFNRIDKRGIAFYNVYSPLSISNLSELIVFKTLSESKEFIKNLEKYPIDYNYEQIN